MQLLRVKKSSGLCLLDLTARFLDQPLVAFLEHLDAGHVFLVDLAVEVALVLEPHQLEAHSLQDAFVVAVLEGRRATKDHLAGLVAGNRSGSEATQERDRLLRDAAAHHDIQALGTGQGHDLVADLEEVVVVHVLAGQAHRARQVHATDHDAGEAVEGIAGEDVLDALGGGDGLNVDQKLDAIKLLALERRLGGGQVFLERIRRLDHRTDDVGHANRAGVEEVLQGLATADLDGQIQTGLGDHFLEAQGLLEAGAFGLKLGLHTDHMVVLAQVDQLFDHLLLKVVHLSSFIVVPGTRP